MSKIPDEIKAVPRPKSTVVKLYGERYLVIKRTSKKVNGKPKPVDLGTVGEIINGRYVEIRKEPRRRSAERKVDVKDSDILRRIYRKEYTLWTDGYFVRTIGNVSQETVKHYIENQG